MEKKFSDFLREIFAADRTILTRYEDLRQAMNEKIPRDFDDEYSILVNAMENYHINEIFAAGEYNHEKAKNDARNRLQKSGVPAKSIDFILKTFEEALDWDKPPLGSVPIEKKITKENPPANFVPANVNLQKEIPPQNPNTRADFQPAKIPIPMKPPEKFELVKLEKIPEIPNEVKTEFQDKTAEIVERARRHKAEPISEEEENHGGSNFKFIALAIVLAGLVVVGMYFLVAKKNNMENNFYLQAETELSLNGLDVGISFEELQSILGEVTPMENIGEYERYEYENLEIGIQNDKVFTLATKSPDLKTLRGLNVGADYDEVVETYGKNFTETDANQFIFCEYSFPALENQSGILRFAVDKSNNRVKYISARLVPARSSIE